MKLDLSNVIDPYDYIRQIILDRFPDAIESFVVELKIRYTSDEEYDDITTLLLNEGDDYLNSDYVWEYDWWEEERDVILVAAAPINDLILPKEWQFAEE